MSRMLSKPAITSSPSVSSSSEAAKKVVGGSCFRSPATTAWRPRSNEVTASCGSTWLASSKITTSNNGRSPGISWLTERGLAIQQGRRANKTSGASASSFLKGR